MFLKFRICWLSQSIPWSWISGHSKKSLKFRFVGTQLCTVELNVRTITNALWGLQKFSYISLCECSHCPVNGDLYEFTKSLKFGSVDFHRMSRKCGYMGVHKYPVNMCLLVFTCSLQFESVRIVSGSVNFGFWEFRKDPLIWIYGL